MDMLRNGSRGEAVTDLQRKLQAMGFNPGQVDGVFGPKTEAAVRRFQETKSLQVDGIVGPQTYTALGMMEAPKPVMESRPMPTPPPAPEPMTSGPAAGIEAMRAAEKEAEKKADAAADAMAGAMKKVEDTTPEKKKRGVRGRLAELLSRSKKEERDR